MFHLMPLWLQWKVTPTFLYDERVPSGPAKRVYKEVCRRVRDAQVEVSSLRKPTTPWEHNDYQEQARLASRTVIDPRDFSFGTAGRTNASSGTEGSFDLVIDETDEKIAESTLTPLGYWDQSGQDEWPRGFSLYCCHQRVQSDQQRTLGHGHHNRHRMRYLHWRVRVITAYCAP